MKRTLLKLTIAISFLLACGATTLNADAGGGQPPLCKPGSPQCPAN